MRNKFEQFLLSLLLGTATLLGLSFWLNTNYNFNIFYQDHWNELAKLQATNTPISHGFYISIIIAISIFILGIYAIYHHKTDTQQIKQNVSAPENLPVTTAEKPETKPDTPKQDSYIPMARPPRLNLPTNMAHVVAQQQLNPTPNQPQQKNTEQNPYTPLISKIFSDAGYLVKPNPTISGFTPNLFAIGPDEILWIGATDVKPQDILKAVEKLQSVFTETLEDIKINVMPFVLDTMNQQQQTDSILIFKTIDELKDFITKNPAEQITDEERGNFDAYSEYIDTIIQYVKNI